MQVENLLSLYQYFRMKDYVENQLRHGMCVGELPGQTSVLTRNFLTKNTIILEYFSNSGQKIIYGK